MSSYTRSHVLALVALAAEGASTGRMSDAMMAKGVNPNVAARIADIVGNAQDDVYDAFVNAVQADGWALVNAKTAAINEGRAQGLDVRAATDFTVEVVRAILANRAAGDPVGDEDDGYEEQTEDEDYEEETVVPTPRRLVRSITVEQYSDGAFRVAGHTGDIRDVSTLERTLRTLLS